MNNFEDIAEAEVACPASSVAGESNYKPAASVLLHMKDLSLDVLSEIIVDYLNEQGISIRSFAKDCKVSHQTITSIVAKKGNPSLDTIIKILDKTKCRAKIFKAWE